MSYRQESNLRTGKSANIKSVDVPSEYFLTVYETKMCVSLCAYNVVTSEVHATQFLDCSTFNVTTSSILRFAPRVLACLEESENSLLMKQIQDELLGNTVATYFIPMIKLNLKHDWVKKLAPKVKNLKDLELCFSILLCLCKDYPLKQENVGYYDVEEVLVFDLQTTLSLDVLQLSKLYSPITNGGKRLLQANLLQPFSTIQNIQLRQQAINSLMISENKIEELKIHLQKFKTVDTLAMGLSAKNLKLQEQLQQLFNLYNFQKNAQTFGSFLEANNLSYVMGQDYIAILMQPDFRFVKSGIETCLDTNQSQNNLLDDQEQLYFIMINERSNNLKSRRRQYIAARTNLNALFQNYVSCIPKLKCKKLKENSKAINCLKNGYIFQLSVNEVNRNNMNEFQIRNEIEKQGDKIIFIDKNSKDYNILTEKLQDYNTQISECINIILAETQMQVQDVYEKIKAQSTWLLQFNCWISQIDVALAMRDYIDNQHKNQQVMNFPQFGSEFLLTEAVFPNKVNETLNLLFNAQVLNVVFEDYGNLSEQLKALGQYVILAQIGSALPCSEFVMNLRRQLFTHFQQFTIQNLAENRSSFTSEIASLTNILNQDLKDALVLCDSLALSSSYESNLSFNLSFLEAISTKVSFGLFGTCDTSQDILQLNQLIKDGCLFMISDQNGIKVADERELDVKFMNNQKIYEEDFNLDYKIKFLTNLKEQFDFPKEFCTLFEKNFNDNYYQQ